MEQKENCDKKMQYNPSPLVVGALTGSLIGMALVLFSVFTGEIIDLPVMLFAAAILGFATGGIFAPIIAPFVRGMEVRKVVLVLAGGTFISGALTIIVCYIGWGGNAIILSWPVGILGYWFSFVFRMELVWIVEQIEKRFFDDLDTVDRQDNQVEKVVSASVRGIKWELGSEPFWLPECEIQDEPERYREL